MTAYYFRVEETTYSAGADEWGDPIPGGPTRPNLLLFEVLRSTPCGVILNVYCESKFVNRNWNKQFAHATVEAAITSFKARKKRQMAIAQATINRAEDSLRYLSDKGFFIDGRKFRSMF